MKHPVPAPTYHPGAGRAAPGRVIIWPRVIGVLSMVWAGRQLAYGLSAGITAVMDYFKYGVWWSLDQGNLPYWIQSLFHSADHVVLLAAGWAVWRQQSAGRMLHLLWAGLAVLVLGGMQIYQGLHGHGYYVSALENWRLAELGLWVLGDWGYVAFVVAWFARPRAGRDLAASTARGGLVVRPEASAARPPAAARVTAEPPAPGRVILWPVVLGVVSMVLAGRGLLQSLYNLVVTWRDWMETNPQSLMRWGIGVPMGLGALLMAAGYLLWRQRRAGRFLHLVWAVLAGLFAIGTTWWFLWRTASDMGGLKRALADFGGSYLVGAAVHLVIDLAYPAFVLFWFSRWQVRRDLREASRWGGRLIVRNVDGTYRQL